MSEANWYVVHTYSGYENKVKTTIEQTIENRKLHDQILEVSVPTQEYTLSLHDALPISEERRVGKECKIGRASCRERV